MHEIHSDARGGNKELPFMILKAWPQSTHYTISLLASVEPHNGNTPTTLVMC